MKSEIASDKASRDIETARRNLERLDPVRLFRDESFSAPPIPGAPMLDVAEYSLKAASRTVRMLERRIRSFEAELPETKAVMFLLVAGPAGTNFLPHRISAYDPDKVVFEGVDADHQPFVLVQHVSQLNFAIRAARLPADEKRQPIGFHFPS